MDITEDYSDIEMGEEERDNNGGQQEERMTREDENKEQDESVDEEQKTKRVSKGKSSKRQSKKGTVVYVNGEKQFKVKSITNMRFNNETGCAEFLIHWENYPTKEWGTIENFDSLEHFLIQSFKKRNPEKYEEVISKEAEFQKRIEQEKRIKEHEKFMFNVPSMRKPGKRTDSEHPDVFKFDEFTYFTNSVFQKIKANPFGFFDLNAFTVEYTEEDGKSPEAMKETFLLFLAMNIPTLSFDELLKLHFYLEIPVNPQLKEKMEVHRENGGVVNFDEEGRILEFKSSCKDCKIIFGEPDPHLMICYLKEKSGKVGPHEHISNEDLATDFAYHFRFSSRDTPVKHEYLIKKFQTLRATPTVNGAICGVKSSEKKWNNIRQIRLLMLTGNPVDDAFVEKAKKDGAIDRDAKGRIVEFRPKNKSRKTWAKTYQDLEVEPEPDNAPSTSSRTDPLMTLGRGSSNFPMVHDDDQSRVAPVKKAVREIGSEEDSEIVDSISD